MTEVHRRLIGVLRGVSLAELFDSAAPKPVPLTALPLLAGSACCSTPAKAVDPATA